MWHHSLDFNSTAYEFAQMRFQSLAKRAKCKNFELNSTHYYGKMHTHAINQKKNNIYLWSNYTTITSESILVFNVFQMPFSPNVRSNLALYFKLKTTIISRKGIWICNLRSFTKKPFCVKSVDIFGQRAVQDHIGTGTQIWSKNSLSLSLSFSERMSTAKRRRWHIPASVTATTTFNPIRSIVDRMKITPNPEKQMIALSIGKLFQY